MGTAFSTSCKHCNVPVRELLHNAWGSEMSIGALNVPRKNPQLFIISVVAQSTPSFLP